MLIYHLYISAILFTRQDLQDYEYARLETQTSIGIDNGVLHSKRITG